MSTIRTLWIKSVVKLTVPKQEIHQKNKLRKACGIDTYRRIPKHASMCDRIHQHPVPDPQSAKTIKN